MEIAFVGESSADAAGVNKLTEALFGPQVTRCDIPVNVRGGWPALLNDLPTVIRATYFKTNAFGLVVVVDSDGTSLHPSSPDNRRVIIDHLIATSRATGRNDRGPLRVAVGIAVPCIEAWWLAHENSAISEHTWFNRHTHPGAPYNKLDLKRQLYGTTVPSIDLETRKMIEAAEIAARNV